MEAQTLFGCDGTQRLDSEQDIGEEKLFLKFLGVSKAVGVSLDDGTFQSMLVAMGHWGCG